LQPIFTAAKQNAWQPLQVVVTDCSGLVAAHLSGNLIQHAAHIWGELESAFAGLIIYIICIACVCVYIACCVEFCSTDLSWGVDFVCDVDGSHLIDVVVCVYERLRISKTIVNFTSRIVT
jgi:hypothetical protein